jgi:hypothetical protein
MKKLLAICIGMMLLAIIPVAAGATNTTTKSPETTDIDMFGRLTIRGFVFGWEEIGNEVHTLALRVHYRYWDLRGEQTSGVVIGKEIIFKDRFAIEEFASWTPFGMFHWVFGIYHGDVVIHDWWPFHLFNHHFPCT